MIVKRDRAMLVDRSHYESPGRSLYACTAPIRRLFEFEGEDLPTHVEFVFSNTPIHHAYRLRVGKEGHGRVYAGKKKMGDHYLCKALRAGLKYYTDYWVRIEYGGDLG